MATTYIRGSNPVWSYVDLTGKQFDDTFYMWVLDNEIPYAPLSVYHQPNGVPWTNPIRFLANGTLPVDIFWDPNQVYRLEFRQHLDPLSSPSQQDPLIYLVEDYVAGSGGETPIEAIGLFTDNQITNAQFSLIDFEPDTTITISSSPTIIDIAPGWSLSLTGTGTVVLDRQAISSTIATPTNAPYALHLTLSGSFSLAKLIQRFEQNGVLWANKYVSTSITARIEGAPQPITVNLVNSQGAPIVNIELNPVNVTGTFTEIQGYALMPASTNTDIPPDAYIEYQVTLPNTCDIYLTSFQIITSDLPTNFPYEQDTIDRQIDHTWHYYKDEVIIKPKDTILTGWNFSLNPFQFNPSAITTQTSQTAYICDQTILHQIAGGSTLKTGKASFANRQCLEVKGINGQPSNKFALIQYIDPTTINPYWSYIVSSLARARIFTDNGTQVGIKMRLIYSDSLPVQISNTEPIASWSGVDPTFSAQWTALSPVNDPTYILPSAYLGAEGDDAFPYFNFDGFILPTKTTGAMTLGIVIYTTNDLNVSSSGNEDYIVFDRISLVPNLFAVDSNPQTLDQVIRQCQFYFESTYNTSVQPGTTSQLASSIAIEQKIYNSGGNLGLIPTNLYYQYKNTKRALLNSTRINFYSPASGSINNILGRIYNAAGLAYSSDFSSSFYTNVDVGQNSFTYFGNNIGGLIQAPVVASTPWCTANFHCTIDARLGTGV